MPESFTVPAPLFQEVCARLGKQPWEEVAPIMQQLMQLAQTQQGEELPPEE